MTHSGDICLKWNNHQASVLTFLESFYQKSSLVDVTLAADGKFIHVHRLVLCACSPYFEELLSRQTEKQAIVYLKDVSYSDLKHLVDFIYKGEVNVSEQELGNFLATARSLKIKGLGSQKESADENSSQPARTEPVSVPARRPPASTLSKAKKRKTTTGPAPVEADPLSMNDDAALSHVSQAGHEEVSVVGTKSYNASCNNAVSASDPLGNTDPLDTPSTSEEIVIDDDESFIDIQGTDQNNDTTTLCMNGSDSIQQVLQLASMLSTPPVSSPRGRATCTICLRQFKNRQSLLRHIGMCEAGELYACVICGKKYQMKDYLLRHVRTHAVDNASSIPLK